MSLAKTTNVRTTTAATNVAKALQDIYLAKKFVAFLHKNVVFARFCLQEYLPAHSGKNVRWLYHNALAIPASALTEGDDPDTVFGGSRATTVNFVEAALATWGDFIEYTEELRDYAHDELMDQFAKLAAQQATETVDRQIHTTANTTTTSRDAGTSMKLDTIRLAALDLEKNDCMPHSKSSDQASYVFMASPEQFEDMRGEGSPAYFQIKTQYHEEASDEVYRGQVKPRDIGYGTEIWVTTNVPQDASTPVNDLGTLIGDEGIGISSFDTDIMQPKVVPVPPTPSLASPLGRRGLVTWKAKFVVALLDSKRVNKLISDVAG